MKNPALVKKLASELAQAAHNIAKDEGDYIAQIVTYRLFIKKLGKYICTKDMLKYTSYISKIEQILDNTDFDELMAYYARLGKDPSVYFYEDFLNAYDPANVKTKGVHYSPPAVVSYMTRCAESILQSRFGKSLSEAVILDPCCGVGTFLEHIENYMQSYSQMIGMELMPVPCKLASNILKNNSVINADGLDINIDINSSGKPLLIIGNPPYSGHSSNTGNIEKLLADYKAGLKERNPKWLQDDYVKFIRMAQHRIETAGQGIIAFITNHSYMFNPTFQAMRSSLMNTFDEIYILDLHGNQKTGDKDENIFRIKMGVAISFMIKTSNSHECKIRYTDLRGDKEHKLNTLSEMDFVNTPWSDITPGKPFFLFMQSDQKLQDEYYSYPSLFDIFSTSSVGFVSSRDSFAVDFDRKVLLYRISDLRNSNISPDEIRSKYRVSDLDIDKARFELQNDPNWQDKAIKVLYRPFDYRWAYYSKSIMERTRLPFMESMMQDNTAIAIGRAGQVTGSEEWDVVFCTDQPADLNLFRRGGAMLFPKYIYKNGYKLPNMNPESVDKDKLFSYIYAVLHSSTYRKRYQDFLKIDYPRVPATQDSQIFDKLAEIGAELINAHLMRDIHPQSDTTQDSLFIGGYRVPDRYLDDRKHRDLDDAEKLHLLKIMAVISTTTALKKRIDQLIELSPPWDTKT